MSNVAIRVEGLGKLYHIGAIQNRHRTFGEAISDAVTAPFRRIRSALRFSKIQDCDGNDTFWALKDISFEVKRGEIVGIIGRNGAGKSTLLKILSRITEPTTGRAQIQGRVGSLLEVGTGFHNELTGRENVYLNGAILGMMNAEINRKFDQIVAFAEIEKFIDTPIKHYSSGMKLRLAFAVAAHLEPEILLVDEVLAVGDAQFQKKCLAKMQDVSQHGRTILFVSHNMQAITRLCERAIWLDAATVAKDGPAPKVVNVYLNSGIESAAAREWSDPAKAPGSEIVRLRAVRVRSKDGQITDTVDIRRPVAIEMEYEVLKSGYLLLPWYDFYNEDGVVAFDAVDLDPAWRQRPRPKGRWVSTAWVPGNLLTEGRICVSAAVSSLNPRRQQFVEHDAVAFQVVDSLDGDSARGDWPGALSGVVRPLLNWSTQFTASNGDTTTITTEKLQSD